jgi:hypothetical protein
MGQAISIDQVFVLDFANDTQEIQSAFQPYYQAAILSEATNPNKLYDLKRLLEEFHLFTSSDVETFARAYFTTQKNPKPNRCTRFSTLLLRAIKYLLQKKKLTFAPV